MNRKLCYGFLFLFVFSFLSCQQYIDYKLINYTDYDVIIEDQHSCRYELLAHEEKIIYHANSARFEIIDNQYPIYIENWFTLTEIKPMKTYEVYIYNDTSTQYELRISNDPYKTSYTIKPGTYILNIYTQNPSAKLYCNDVEYHNYNFSNNTLHIF